MSRTSKRQRRFGKREVTLALQPARKGKSEERPRPTGGRMDRFLPVGGLTVAHSLPREQAKALVALRNSLD